MFHVEQLDEMVLFHVKPKPLKIAQKRAKMAVFGVFLLVFGAKIIVKNNFSGPLHVKF